jgi:hypothetical protein
MSMTLNNEFFLKGDFFCFFCFLVFVDKVAMYACCKDINEQLFDLYCDPKFLLCLVQNFGGNYPLTHLGGERIWPRGGGRTV